MFWGRARLLRERKAGGGRCPIRWGWSLGFSLEGMGVTEGCGLPGDVRDLGSQGGEVGKEMGWEAAEAPPWRPGES